MRLVTGVGIVFIGKVWAVVAKIMSVDRTFKIFAFLYPIDGR